MAALPNPPLIESSRKNRGDYIALGVLFFVNLINYMDRVTIAAVLDEVQIYYQLSDKEKGFLQTVFVISYMLFAPAFGYLGDRYSRKILMAVGVLFWSFTTLLGSWPPSKDNFALFLVLRALVGVGEASYSTIAPTIIGDIFPEERRTVALGVFYYAIPIGSGLGYVVGSGLSKTMGGWFWALRLTPILGMAATLLILFVLREPPRGQADGGVQLTSTSLIEDIKDLSRNMSFVLSTLGFTAATFALGAMSWWAPNFIILAQGRQDPNFNKTKINLIFGTITCFGGALGITCAVYLSRSLRSRFKPIDPAICVTGLILGIPLILGAVLLTETQPTSTWLLFFCGLTFLSLNWSIVPDILLYTVLPIRRGTASAMQILFSHLLGDAASPYLVGMISDSIFNSKPPSADAKFTSLRDAMLLPVAILVLGAIAFLFNIFTINHDKERYQMQIKAAVDTSCTSCSSNSSGGSSSSNSSNNNILEMSSAKSGKHFEVFKL